MDFYAFMTSMVGVTNRETNMPKTADKAPAASLTKTQKGLLTTVVEDKTFVADHGRTVTSLYVLEEKGLVEHRSTKKNADNPKEWTWKATKEGRAEAKGIESRKLK